MAFILRVPLPEQSMDRLHVAAQEMDRGIESAAGMLLSNALVSLPTHGRYAVLDQPELQALEDILGGGSILNGADLLKKVQRLAGISYQHVRLNFTPGQLEQIQEKAKRQGKTVEQLVELMAPRIADQFFGLIDTRG